MYQHHATATRSRRDLASNLGKTAFVLSKTTSVRVGSGLFEQTGALKGVRIRACLAGLSMKPQSSLANAPAFELRSVTVRMHRSTTTHQSKSFEPPTTDVALIEGCLRKRNPAKQALTG